MDISAQASSLPERPQRIIWVTSVRMRWEDPTSISCHPLADLGGQLSLFQMLTKANNYPALLDYLFNLGRETADAWFARHETDIGQKSKSICKHYCRRIFDQTCPLVANSVTKLFSAPKRGTPF